MHTRCYLLLLCLAALCLPPTPVAAQLPPEQALAALEARGDLEITLFASEPLITNPTAIDVDARGRVWVCEGQWYRAAAKNPPADRIKVLEDTDGDGLADKVTIFAEGLLVPMGICVAGNRVYVAETPTIWVYEDNDGDLRADGPPRPLLRGFHGRNHDHGVHGLVLGPDHKLYMTVGDKGFDVTGPDGRRIQYPWGAMIRCELDGTQLEAFAVNFRNPYELAVDSWGNVWCSDNDRDGLRSVRICWILEGGNYGWYGQPEMIRNPDGSYDPRHHWRVFHLGIVPYVLITGFGSPCGMTFYEGKLLPRDLFGGLLHTDAGPRVLRCYRPTPYGAGYRATPEILVHTERDPYFRPVDVCVGPAGEVYVADWYDHMVGGHAYNNPDQGRIYLIRPRRRNEAGAPRRTAEPRTLDHALEALGSPNLATQYLARQRLIEAGAAAVEPVAVLAQTAEPIVAARALWVLDRLGRPGQAKVLAYLRHQDPRFRALAVRILRRHGAQYAWEFFRLVQDPDPAVRRELLLAAATLGGQRIDEAVVQLAKRWDGQDRFYLEAIGIAARGRPQRRERLLRALVYEKPLWERREVQLLRLLRGEQDAAGELAEAFQDRRLGAAGRLAALDAFAYSTTPDAGRVLAKVAADQQQEVEVRAKALEALRLGIGQHWKPLRSEPMFRSAWKQALGDNNLAQAACTLVAEGAIREAAPELATLAADERRPEPIRVLALRTLTRLGASSATNVLERLLGASSAPIRSAAIDGLVRLRRFPPLGARLKDSKVPLAVRRQIVRRLMQDSEAALWLLEQVKSAAITEPLRREAVLLGVKHADVNVRTLYQPLAADIERPKTLGEVIKPEEILRLEGDPQRGRKLFESAGSAPCIRCHMVRGKGGDIGPDLSQIGRKYDRAAILDAVLYPNKAVAPEFQTYLVLTKDGRVFAGFLREQSAHRVVLHTAEGQLVALPRERIEAMRPQQASIMPELTIGSLTAQDAADLLAYLASLREETQTITGWWALGPFGFSDDAGFDRPYAPERQPARVELQRFYTVLQGRKARWEPVGTMLFQGYQGIDLVRLCRRHGQRTTRVVYYFAVGILSDSDQDATLLFGSDDGLKVWLNGTLVHAVHQHRPARYGEDQVGVRLRRGYNALLVKLEQQLSGSGLMAAIAVESRVQFVPPRDEQVSQE